jgi:hypothetical protein
MARINTRDLLELATQAGFEIKFITRDTSEMTVEDYDIHWTVTSASRGTGEWTLMCHGYRHTQGKKAGSVFNTQYIVPDQTVRYYDEPYNCAVEFRGRQGRVDLEINHTASLMRSVIRAWCQDNDKKSWDDELKAIDGHSCVVDTVALFKYASTVQVDREIEDNEMFEVERLAQVGQASAWYLEYNDGKGVTIPNQQAQLYDNGRVDVHDLDGALVRLVVFRETPMTGYDLSVEVEAQTGFLKPTLRVLANEGHGWVNLSETREPRPLEFGKPGPARKLPTSQEKKHE